MNKTENLVTNLDDSTHGDQTPSKIVSNTDRLGSNRGGHGHTPLNRESDLTEFN